MANSLKDPSISELIKRIRMASNLKLGSNWKACGYLYDMRRWSHSNTRVRKSMRMFPLERLLD